MHVSGTPPFNEEWYEFDVPELGGGGDSVLTFLSDRHLQTEFNVVIS